MGFWEWVLIISGVIVYVFLGIVCAVIVRRLQGGDEQNDMVCVIVWPFVLIAGLVYLVYIPFDMGVGYIIDKLYDRFGG